MRMMLFKNTIMTLKFNWRSKRRETPNTTTTTVDLPPELWLEILSYLPHIYLRRMMGVSRTLYALALPDMFRELNLAHPHSRMMSHLGKWLK